MENGSPVDFKLDLVAGGIWEIGYDHIISSICGESLICHREFVVCHHHPVPAKVERRLLAVEIVIMDRSHVRIDPERFGD